MCEVYATLVTNADYARGARALARSLRQAGATRPLLVLATESVPDLEPLLREGCLVERVRQPAVSADFRARHARPSLHAAAPFSKGEKPLFHDPLDNFCKLSLWRLERYQKIVFIDADALVLRNVDRLFAYPAFVGAPNIYEQLSDVGRLNSGVFVMRPNPREYDHMLATLDAPGAFWRRTDQTFLEAWYPDWHGLPYTFNVLQYVFFNLPQLWHWPALKILHYQYEKPWAASHPKRHLLGPLIDLWQRLDGGGSLPADLPTPFGGEAACASR
ncbi:Alpha-N-acetylglucosamine transferase [Arboricoccus pini]|uniref:Alpha-N-acetylglucosamine transferase n=1 Tax=Arboricoccus pini TaxID=1963835 RepID=A0A212RUX0_9PROT|nr:glycosyltransferase [Arboricoccus pini]SNB76447.1 Alpha-N-acetylglucosamine transferase [Arboricoccus pini]